MEYKYIKPASLAWWASLVPLIAGLLMAAEPIHAMPQLTAALSNMFAGQTAAQLIQLGLLGIGIRGAIK